MLQFGITSSDRSEHAPSLIFRDYHCYIEYSQPAPIISVRVLIVKRLRLLPFGNVLMLPSLCFSSSFFFFFFTFYLQSLNCYLLRLSTYLGIRSTTFCFGDSLKDIVNCAERSCRRRRHHLHPFTLGSRERGYILKFSIYWQFKCDINNLAFQVEPNNDRARGLTLMKHVKKDRSLLQIPPRSVDNALTICQG